MWGGRGGQGDGSPEEQGAEGVQEVLLMTVNREAPKISPRGVETSHSNAV